MNNPFLDRDAFPAQRTVLENALCVFVQTPQPVLAGSGLITPKALRETPFDLSPDEWTATFELLQQVKTQLDKTLHPDGYNLGWNVGAVGGQTVSQVHLHVIPRFKDEPLAGRGIRYFLKQPENGRPR